MRDIWRLFHWALFLWRKSLTMIIAPIRSLAAFVTLMTSAAYVQAQQHSLTMFVRPGSMEHVMAYMAESTDVAPSFPGGENAMFRFINEVRHYPAAAYEAGVEGRVRCGFIVDVDGSIDNDPVQRGNNADLNHEAVRIIESMPRWEPAMIDGEPVPVFYLLTIPFRL